MNLKNTLRIRKQFYQLCLRLPYKLPKIKHKNNVYYWIDTVDTKALDEFLLSADCAVHMYGGKTNGFAAKCVLKSYNEKCLEEQNKCIYK